MDPQTDLTSDKNTHTPEEWNALKAEVTELQCQNLDQGKLCLKIQKLEQEIQKLKEVAAVTPVAETQSERFKKYEEVITRAKGMLFEKEKTIVNQGRQVEALNKQISSLKEVILVTKELLEIRNSEVGHLQTKMDTMDAKLDAEKQRHNLILKKFDVVSRVNQDLKNEYETQLKIFKELRSKYDIRTTELNRENEDLKSQVSSLQDEAKKNKENCAAPAGLSDTNKE